MFSALQKKRLAHYLLAILIMSRDITVYVPDHFWDEFVKHRDKLARVTKLSTEEIEELVEILNEHTITVPKAEYGDYLKTAEETCMDLKDAPYVALALAIGGTLITGDKHLIEDASKIAPVITPGEMIALLKGRDKKGAL